MGFRDSFILGTRAGQRRAGLLVLGSALVLGGGAYLAFAQPPEDGKTGAATADGSRRGEGARNGEGAGGRRGFGGGKGGARSASVAAVTARLGDLEVKLAALGTVTASNTAVVRPRVDGQLQRIGFREGQWVRAGDVLAQLDPRPFQIQFDQAQAQLLRDQALLASARVDLERYRGLLAKDSIARQQVDTQEATVRQQEASVAASRAQAANAHLQLDFSRITAPAAGRLGLRQVDVGNTVRANDASGLVTITQTRPIHVLFAIPAQQIGAVAGRLQAGAALAVDALDQDGQTLLARGHLLSVDNQIDPSTGTVKLKAEFANRDDRLFPNQFVNVRLSVATAKGGVLLPTAAVQHDGDGNRVYVIDAKTKTVASRPVTLGASAGDTVVVAQGLAAGERVVLDGTDKLRPGAPVRVVVLDGKPVKEGGPGRNEGKGGPDGGQGRRMALGTAAPALAADKSSR